MSDRKKGMYSNFESAGLVTTQRTNTHTRTHAHTNAHTASITLDRGATSHWGFTPFTAANSSISCEESGLRRQDS